MGVAKILGTGRNEELLERVKALSPRRIEVLKLGDKSSGEWAKAQTRGEGADFVISALGARADAATMLDSMHGVRRGGRVVNVGGVADEVPVDMKWLMDEQVQIIGSNWFTAAQGQEMADMIETGTLDLSVPGDRGVPLVRRQHRDLRPPEGPPRRLQQLCRHSLINVAAGRPFGDGRPVVSGKRPDTTGTPLRRRRR